MFWKSYKGRSLYPELATPDPVLSMETEPSTVHEEEVIPGVGIHAMFSDPNGSFAMFNSMLHERELGPSGASNLNP